MEARNDDAPRQVERFERLRVRPQRQRLRLRDGDERRRQEQAHDAPGGELGPLGGLHGSRPAPRLLAESKPGLDRSYPRAAPVIACLSDLGAEGAGEGGRPRATGGRVVGLAAGDSIASQTCPESDLKLCRRAQCLVPQHGKCTHPQCEMPDPAVAEAASSTIWVTAASSVALVVGTVGATVVGALIASKALDDEIDPELLQDEAAGQEQQQSGRRRRMTLEEAEQRQQQQQPEAAAAAGQPENK
ncbi:MAG: hypothetical protein J3K34DRAFT_418741 [Monoraphidium minutum]|nr:MAG: hypothetical protein J3K34DRAFT_418741 [Monoraphidium minutum]